MLGLGKSGWGGGGGGLICGILTFPCDDHYRPSYFLWLFGRENDKVRHNMTQIASWLAVATVFIDLWTLFYSQGGGPGLIREIKLPMQELELKMQGGLIREGGGGRNHGILR